MVVNQVQNGLEATGKFSNYATICITSIILCITISLLLSELSSKKTTIAPFSLKQRNSKGEYEGTFTFNNNVYDAKFPFDTKIVYFDSANPLDYTNRSKSTTISTMFCVILIELCVIYLVYLCTKNPTCNQLTGARFAYKFITNY